MEDKYQDYVIKDGKFIGKFDEMYQKFDDPWKQKEHLNKLYCHYSTVVTLNNFNVKHVLEVGCGLGALTNFLSMMCRNTVIDGLDISKIAIENARKSFPHLTFICDNIKDFCKQPNVHSGGGYDALLFTEILWYILEYLDDIIVSIQQNYKNCLFIVNQTFYHGGQEYGTDYFTSLDEMIEYFPFKLLYKIQVDNYERDAIETHSVFRI